MIRSLLIKAVCAAALGCHAPSKLAIANLIAGQFDAATTYRSLSNCPPTWTCWEVNPLFKPFASSPAAFPAMFESDLITNHLLAKLAHRHKRLSEALMIGSIGLHIWAGYHNMQFYNSYSQPGEQPQTVFHIHQP